MGVHGHPAEDRGGTVVRAYLGIFCAVVVVASLVPRPADAARMSSTFETVDFRGVRGAFGLTLEYPANALARVAGVVSLAYAPGPLPVTVTVDVLRLLAANDPAISVPAWVADQVNATGALVGKPDPWVVSLPLTDTPIGSYVLQSFPILAEPGVGLFLDVTLNGQVNGTLTTNGGSLDRSTLVWTRWGGEEANFTAPATPGVATVTASFVYYVSAAFVVRLDVVGFPATYPVATFPLGQMPFDRNAETRVEVLDTTSAAGPTDTSGSVVVGAGLGLVIGVAVGVGVGWAVRARRRAGRP